MEMDNAVDIGDDVAASIHAGLTPQTRFQRAAGWGRDFVNYEGEGLSSWLMHKATRLGDGGWQGAMGRMRQFSGAKTVLGGAARMAGRGALSSFLPIEPFSGEQMTAMAKIGSFGKGGAKGLLGAAKSGLGGAIFKWVGPIIMAYRLATETGGQGLLGGMDKAVRIVGEETLMTAGGVLGGMIGTAIGGPGGTAVGIVAGMAIGYAGAWAWNKFVDAAEAPAKLAHAGWKYFREAGRRSAKLELGGGISRANRTGMAYTMRQRALSQMNRSGMNARSLLGQEAAYMHIR